MKAAENITEELKAKDMMAWMRAINNISNRADEV
ncbi:MAG TPA: TnpV protein, partial [Candidatus Copromorpha excrementigallinarum]|nr:TnpV protein [Candidatus Copromorpha excrementigallinarum]